MRLKLALGAVTASALIGFGALAGSVIGGVYAQAPTGTTQAPAGQVQMLQAQTQPAATPAPGNTAPGGAPQRGGPGPRGGHPGGFGGGFGPGKGFPGGPGPMMGHGGKGFGARGETEAGANGAITRTTNLVTNAKSDLAYANGKMDTTSITKWLNDADAAVNNAKSAVSATKYGSTLAYTQAASQLVELAEQQMGQTLGFDKLPSAAQRPQHFNKGPQTAPSSITQAQASRLLAQTYNQIVAQGTLIKNGKATDANSYLIEAQNAYKAAYNSYGAGKYQDAANSARLADQLLGVASSLNRAATDTTTGTDTPVQVPSPNF